MSTQVTTNENTVNVTTSGQTVVVQASGIQGPQGPAGADGAVQPTGSFAITGSNSFVGDQIITGSLTISGSSTFTNIGPAIFSGSITTTAGITGSLSGTATSASFAVTASHALFAVSASHEITFEVSSSHAQTADHAGDLFGTPSIVVNEITASGDISASGDIFANDITLDAIGISDKPNVTLKRGSTTGILLQMGSGGNDEGILLINNHAGQGDIRFQGGGNSFFSQSLNVGVPYAYPEPVGGTFTVRGTISSSGAINTLSHITASGNISASGDIKANNGLFNAGGISIGSNVIDFSTPNLRIKNTGLNVFGGPLTGSIISASGDLKAGKLFIDDKAAIDLYSGIGNELTLNPDATFDAIRLNRDGQPRPIILEGNVTASGNISASSATITALTGSFNHIITDDDTIEFRNRTTGVRTGRLKFDASTGLNVEDNTGTRTKIRAGRGEFLSLEAGPVGFNSLGSITASVNISASGDIVANNLSGTNTGDQDLSNLITNSSTASFAITGSDVIFGNITASGNISASNTVFGVTGSFNQISSNPANVKTDITMGGDSIDIGNTSTAASLGEVSFPFTKLAGSTTFQGMVAATNFLVGGGNTEEALGGIPTTSTLRIGGVRPGIFGTTYTVGVDITGNVTASGAISASGAIIGETVTTTGNITSGDRIIATGRIIGNSSVSGTEGTFTSITNVNTTHVTASGNISASGQIIGDIVDTSFETFFNFEAATAFTYIAPFGLTVNFTGSSTASMDVVGFVTASANTETFSSQQPLPITLNQFDKLKITPAAVGLFIISGSRTI